MIRSTLDISESALGATGQTHPAQVQSTSDRERFHVAIIMDGNGRWAQHRHRPRAAGHVAGISALRRTVEAAPELGITTLTMYAFSSDNWRRPRPEVTHLMRLFRRHLQSECEDLVDAGIRLNVIGRRDRIPEALERQISHVEERTMNGRALHLRLAIDYSGRDALLAAAEAVGHRVRPSRQRFEESMSRAIHAPAGTGDVDLLIRTGGERRLSDFLLWEVAYAELLFSNVLWPNFTGADLAAAVDDFASRDRRFGGLPRQSVPPTTLANRRFP